VKNVSEKALVDDILIGCGALTLAIKGKRFSMEWNLNVRECDEMSPVNVKDSCVTPYLYIIGGFVEL
jgi:hypothetical protein